MERKSFGHTCHKQQRERMVFPEKTHPTHISAQACLFLSDNLRSQDECGSFASDNGSTFRSFVPNIILFQWPGRVYLFMKTRTLAF